MSLKSWIGGIIIVVALFSLIYIGIEYPNGFNTYTQEQRSISAYYSQEVLVSVSPTDYLKEIKSGNTGLIAVDLRSAPEYNVSHLVTSINIPAGQLTSPQLISAFDALPKDKTIITYCYSSYCMLSRNVGKVLADNGIFVKHFTAGWLEINRDYNNYIAYGKDPGILNVNTTSGACNINDTGEFGC
jgi:rhodanese-related sulfurtransferase